MNKKEKILVAMSGGVDSSVAAALLVEQGYDVTGMFAVNYQASSSGLRPTSLESEFIGRSEAKPCWRPDYQDALRVAAHLGIPLLRWDFVKEYKAMVLDYMYKEYEKGRTPNPDVMCNRHIKFGVWLEKARKLGFTKLATGHYGVIKRNKIQEIPTGHPSTGTNKSQLLITNYQLLCAKDDNKDQTYFLHQLNQEQLSHVLFPLGDYTKPEVRKLAKKFKLPTAEKEESMGICFVGEVPMKEFLENKVKNNIKKGDIIMSDGVKVGEHDGLAFCTIGQRHGFKQVGGDKPLFVVGKDFEKNQLIVGYEDNPLLFNKEIEVEDLHWIGQEPKFPLKCKVRMRHRQPLQNAECRMSRQSMGSLISSGQNGNLVVKFDKRERAVTPGQFAVFYLPRRSSEGAKVGKVVECLGGGVIK